MTLIGSCERGRRIRVAVPNAASVTARTCFTAACFRSKTDTLRAGEPD